LHVWLLEQRMIAATRYMVAAGSVKEGARRANYRRTATFTEHFIHYHEISPSYYLKQVRSGRWPTDFC
jgi:AraC-like DNA-binding protein